MKCPRCGGEIKDGMLFCEQCGEEIRIVQDFEPELDGIVTGFENTTSVQQAKVNTETDEEPEDARPSPAPAGPPKRKAPKKRAAAYLGGLLTALCVLLLAISCFHYQNADYLYERALTYIKSGSFDKAYPFAQRAARLKPDDTEYLAAYVVCLSEAGEEEKTVEVCERILSLDASNAQAYQELVTIYESHGAYEKINELLLSCPDEKIVNKYPAYVAKPPEFSYESGIYNETVSLRLSANTSGTIYYTLDGSAPDENGTVYTAPIFLESGSYRIRAVFINEYGVASEEAAGNYYVDVSIPAAPPVTPEAGEYSRPTLITVSAGENCRIYYTTDGSVPSRDKTEYTGPIPMPVGVTRFRFVCYSISGVASEEIQVTYSLNLHASLSIEAARNKLLIELMAANIIQDMNGTVKTGTGHYVYNYRYAVTINGTDYYLYREYYEDDAGNSAGTGTDYVVDIMNGQCYKAVRAQPAASKAFAADSGGTSSSEEEGGQSALEAETASENPWAGLLLQEIDSGTTTE